MISFTGITKICEEQKNENYEEIRKILRSVKINENNTYQLPTNNCVFLPINATTAEQIATYILQELQTKITFPKNVTSLDLGVDEGYGQGAWITKKLD